MAEKIWNLRVEGDGSERVCYVAVNTPSGIKEVEIGVEIEGLMEELQREYDKYTQREYRHESRLELTPIAQIPPRFFGKSPEDLLIERYENDQLKDALKHISIVQCRRFLLKYDYRLKTEQIAQLEGCSSRAIERSLTSARRKLRKLLQK